MRLDIMRGARMVGIADGGQGVSAPLAAQSISGGGKSPINAQDSKISMVQWTLNLLLIIIVLVLAAPYVVRSIREQED